MLNSLLFNHVFKSVVTVNQAPLQVVRSVQFAFKDNLQLFPKVNKLH